MFKIRIKTMDGQTLAEWNSINTKVEVEIEKEIGDDITEITTLRGLQLGHPQNRPQCDCWFTKYKNERERV